MSPRPARVAPHEMCVNWPNTASDDPVAEVARRLVLNLRDAMAGRSVREIALITEVDRATMGAVLNGLSWPDMVTVAKLERGLGQALWPGIVD